MLAKIQSQDTILYFCIHLKPKKNEKTTFFYPHIFYACFYERSRTRSASCF